MKKIILCSLLMLIGSIGNISAQSWRVTNEDQKNNFLEIQQDFENHWQEKDHTLPGKGWKPFKRWEYFMEARTYPTGELPNPMILFNEWQKYQPVNKTNNTAGNWSFMGPGKIPTNGGMGRINCIRFNPLNTNSLWVGSASGGLWKSVDGGTTWNTNTDLLPTLGVTDIVIHPTDSSILYLGTGDADGTDTYSVGVLKSTDGGITWNTTGLNWNVTQVRTIRRLIMHPTNANILIAATSAGIFRTLDAGVTWIQEYATAMKDVEFKPGDPTIVYASSTTKIFKSINGGDTWPQVTTGLPTTGVNRIAIAVTPAEPTAVYAICSASADDGFYGLYKSTDSGTSWTLQSNTPNIMGYDADGGDAGGQGWYDLVLTASPTTANVIYTGGVNIWKSTDGGKNWTVVSHWTGSGAPRVHADQHAFEFVPGSNTAVVAGNDGGVFRSSDGGTTWTDKSTGLQISQFYKLGVSATNASLVLLGAQDNGTPRMNGTTWTRVIGGDGMECLIDYSNTNYMYGELYYGDIRRSGNGGSSFTSIKPSAAGNGAWVTPFVIHPSNPQILYAGFKEVYMTGDRGTAWNAISSNLTGGTATLRSMAVAPGNGNIIYTGTTAKLFKTSNQGGNWTEITLGLPVSSAAITHIAVHPTDPNTVWVTFSGYQAGKKVYKSTDGGSNWTNISGTLPNVPVNCITYEDASQGGLYIGTDLGVFFTDNTMSDWISFNKNLPNVMVYELEIQYTVKKLRAATYGRGLWESDLYGNPTSLIQHGVVPAVTIYPNPTNGDVTIDITGSTAGDLTISVYNSIGTLVKKIETTSSISADQKTIIDLSSYPAGAYFVRVKQGGEVFTKIISKL